MSKVVYKYEVRCCNSRKKVAIPKGASIISAIHKEPANVGDGLWIYAEVDVEQESMELYEFTAIGTGRIFEKSNDIFLDTVRVPYPINEVYHVYYRKT